MKPTRQAVTKQKSAEIDARLGQLCAPAASAREIGAPAASASEITAQLNEEFGLHWKEHAYWKRARKAGYHWPGSTARRLTAEESEQMDRLLRELCEAKIPGTEIIETVNGELGLNWGFASYWSRVKRLGLLWTETPLTGRPWPGVEYLPEDQRAACYEDPAYEARNRIADRVACRECCREALLDPTWKVPLLRDGGMDGKLGHVSTIHKMSEHQYHMRNPGAPMFTFQRKADQDNRDVDQLMENFAKKYATPKVLTAADSDPEYEVHNDPEHVICRVARCGRKSRGSLKKHLESQHDVTDVDVYRREHNWAPIIAPNAAKTKAEELRERNKDKRRRLEEAERLAAKLGRPRTLKDDAAKYGPRITELRNGHKSWGQVHVIMNQETGQNRSVSGWRHLIENPGPTNAPTSRKHL